MKIERVIARFAKVLKEQAAKKWVTDRQMEKLVGRGWTSELEFREEQSKSSMLKEANKYLKEHNKKLRVVDYREHSSGDYLEWLVS